MNAKITNEPSNVQITQLYLQVFRIGEKEIAELWATLECSGKNRVKANARCADYMERRFETKQGFVQFDNMDKRRIRELTLWTSNEETKSPNGHVSLHTEGTDPNVSIHLTGRDEAEIRKICESIKEILERSQPGYAILAKTKGIIYAVVAVVGIEIVDRLNRIVAASPWGDPALGWSEGTKQIYSWIILAFLIIWVIWIGGNATEFWRKYFPIGCIQTGDQVRLEKMKQKWRWIAASLAIGAIVSVIVRWVV